VPRQRQGKSKALAFDSHAFASMSAPQIAVVDATASDSASDRRNRTTSSILISVKDKVGQEKTETSDEALQFSSVIAVKPGDYQVHLSRGGAAHETKVPLRAANRKRYVLMRVGHTGDDSELVVFPQSGAWSTRTGPQLVIGCLLIMMSSSWR